MERTDECDARMLAEVLRQDEANRRSMFSWAHASWLSDTLPLGESAIAPALAAYAPRWLEIVGVAPLALHGLRGHARSLAALPISGSMRMLRLRVLWARRAELRHWVDRPRRMRLVAAIGPAAADRLRQDSATSLRIPPWLDEAPAWEAMSDEALAWAGYCLFEADGVWPGNGVLPLVRVALPRHAARPPWTAKYRPSRDENGSAAVMEYVPLISSE